MLYYYPKHSGDGLADQNQDRKKGPVGPQILKCQLLEAHRMYWFHQISKARGLPSDTRVKVPEKHFQSDDGPGLLEDDHLGFRALKRSPAWDSRTAPSWKVEPSAHTSQPSMCDCHSSKTSSFSICLLASLMLEQTAFMAWRASITAA